LRLNSSRGTDVGPQSAHLLRELNNHLVDGVTAESLLSVGISYGYNPYTLAILSILILRIILSKVEKSWYLFRLWYKFLVTIRVWILCFQ